MRFSTALRALVAAGALSIPLLTGAMPTLAEGTPHSDAVLIKGHAKLDVLPSGGGGTVTIDAVTTCTVTSDGEESTPYNCAFSIVNGAFANTVCGTGTVSADSFLVDAGAIEGTTTGGATTVQFVGGHGALVNQAVTENSTADGTNSALFNGTIDAVADPNLTPTDGFCTHGFTFTISGSVTE